LKLLVFDNYDSFTYNLVHLAEKILHQKVDVCCNNAITIDEIRKYDKIILSPGPGLPAQSGILLDVIREFASQKSILGVCLGHQAIAEVFGANLQNLPMVYHGVASVIKITDREEPLFLGLDETIEVGRYHSWAVFPESMPDCLKVTAVDKDGCIMALRHLEYDVRAVQFHPESVMTPSGEKMLKNWLKG